VIPANRLRPALWGWALTSLLLLAGMFLVRTYGATASSRTYVAFLVNVALVVSLQTFVGNSGIVSFGHVAFMGIGAYTTALVTISAATKASQLPDLPSVVGNANLGLVPAIAVSVLVALAVAAVFGGAVIRMTESTMAMATLALLVVVHTFFQNATTYTRGAIGLAGVPVRTTIGVATVAAISFVLVSRLYKESGPGLRLRASREDPLSAASVGTHVVRSRYGVWLLSAAMMGAAGSLWAQNVIAFNANQFYFSITFALLAMLVVGGRTSLTGAVAGAAIITFLTDTLARVEQGVAIGPWELPKITGSVQFVIAFLIIITLMGDRRPPAAARSARGTSSARGPRPRGGGVRADRAGPEVCRARPEGAGPAGRAGREALPGRECARGGRHRRAAG
jgi:branched-chain amino acid transport system permease protein